MVSEGVCRVTPPFGETGTQLEDKFDIPMYKKAPPQ